MNIYAKHTRDKPCESNMVDVRVRVRVGVSDRGEGKLSLHPWILLDHVGIDVSSSKVPASKM